MATSLRPVTVAPKGMGLNDFVAHQEGFFAAEGLDVDLDWKTFRGTQSSWKGLDYFQRPQDRPYTQDKRDVIQGACVWGTHLQRQRRHGTDGARRLRGLAVGDLRAAGLEDPPAGGSQGRAGVGRHARRQPFQRAVPAGEISAAREHQGGEYRRLRRAAARRCSTARSRPRACCRRRSRWPSSSACARSSRTRSRRCGGCRTTSSRRSCAAICARSTAPSRPWMPIWPSTCRCGSMRCRPSSRASIHGTSRSSAAASGSYYRDAPARGIRRDAGAGQALGPRSVPQGSQLRESELLGRAVATSEGWAADVTVAPSFIVHTFVMPR